MTPLLWSSWWTVLLAAVPWAYLLSIELGTSRGASRNDDGSAVELETLTGKLVDAGAGIAIVGGVLSSLFLQGTTIEPRVLPFIVGLVFMSGAGALSVYARKHLGRFHRDNLTHHADHQLVSTGPYGHVRHPLYTATSLAFVGIGCICGTWVSVGLAVLPVLGLLHRIRVEERLLDRALGERYRTYSQDKARLIPGIW